MTPEEERLIRIDERTESMAKVIDRLETVVIRGNGRPSILSRLDALEGDKKLIIALGTGLVSLGTAIGGMFLT